LIGIWIALAILSAGVTAGVARCIGLSQKEGFLKRLALGISLLTLAVLVGLPSLARADTITIGLQEAGVNGGAITTVATGSGFAANGLAYGTFTLNSVSGAGSPFLPEPQLDSSSLNISSTAAGTLTVYVTEQGLSTPTGVNQFISSFTENLLTGKVTSVAESTFVDLGNGLFGGSPLASFTVTSGSGPAVLVTAATPLLTAPYSETEKFVVTAAGVGSGNQTIDILAAVPVPEPGSLSLLSSGLFGFALLGLRRRKVTS